MTGVPSTKNGDVPHKLKIITKIKNTLIHQRCTHRMYVSTPTLLQTNKKNNNEIILAECKNCGGEPSQAVVNCFVTL